ncbi:MAG: hypothetical protein C9356_15190 [Oleiphilus sp.]|nr:MAG: hypothetical protein C9356_15190 [Oleiphilus sp.]
MSDFDKHISGLTVITKSDDWKGGSTLRFSNGTACCTCTYNFSMTKAEQHQLARRIRASLNAFKNVPVEEIEALVGP